MSAISIKRSTVISLSLLALLLIGISGIVGYSISNKQEKNDSKTEKVSNIKQDEVMEIKTETPTTAKPASTDNKVEDTIKMVLTKEEVVQETKKAEEKSPLVYTNPYFPTLSLPYTSDWYFDTTTSNSYIEKGLLNREVTFGRLNADNKPIEVKIRLMPIGNIDGGGGTVENRIIETKKLGQINKMTIQDYDVEKRANVGSQYLAYGPKEQVYYNFGTITSNISNDGYDDYNKLFSVVAQVVNDNVGTIDPNNVTYLYSISVTQPNKITTEDGNIYIGAGDPIVPEIDKLISGFKF